VLFTQDADLLIEASARQRSGTPFAGVIYSHQDALEIGGYVEELELIAAVYEPADMSAALSGYRSNKSRRGGPSPWASY
jgi:hypothetical protein